MGFLDYLSGKISLVQLRYWYASISMDAVSSSNPDAVRIANAIIGDFSDFDEGFLSEDELKKNLSALLFPSPSLTSVKEFVFQATVPAVQTGTSSITAAGRQPAFAGARLSLEYAS